MKYQTWLPIEAAPTDSTLVLVVMSDDEVLTARNVGAADGHNGWWTADGLDLGYGFETPVGWLPRDALPSILNPVRETTQ